jgi:hypothetical protein
MVCSAADSTFDCGALTTITPRRVAEHEPRIRHHVRALWIADAQWKKAEARCRALAMELNLLRIGKEAPPDKPIESLAPPECWRKAWLRAGIETVNQLRSIDPVTLLAQWRFPRGALDWAVMKLDREGLSHRLIRAKRTHMPPSVSRRIER